MKTEKEKTLPGISEGCSMSDRPVGKKKNQKIKRDKEITGCKPAI